MLSQFVHQRWTKGTRDVTEAERLAFYRLNDSQGGDQNQEQEQRPLYPSGEIEALDIEGEGPIRSPMPKPLFGGFERQRTPLSRGRGFVANREEQREVPESPLAELQRRIIREQCTQQPEREDDIKQRDLPESPLARRSGNSAGGRTQMRPQGPLTEHAGAEDDEDVYEESSGDETERKPALSRQAIPDVTPQDGEDIDSP